MKNLTKLAVLFIFFNTLLLSCVSNDRSNITHLPFRLSEGGNWGIISTDGEVVISGEYTTAPFAATEGVFIIRTENGKYEYYKTDPVPVKIGGQYIKAGAFSESLAPVMEREDIISLINTEGNVVFSLENVNGKRIISCSSYSNGLALIEDEDGLKGFVDKKGKVVLPPQYDDASDFDDGHAVVVRRESDKKYWQIINKKGEIVHELNSETKATLENISSGLLGFTISENSDAWGFISTKGEEIVQPSRDYVMIKPVNFKMFAYNNGNKMGVAAIDGKRVLPAEFDDVEHSGGNNFIVQKGEVWFIVDKDNKEAGNVDFTDHTSNINGYFFAKVRDKFILLDSKGKRKGDGEFHEVKLNTPPHSVRLDLVNFRKSVSDLFQIIAPGQLWRLKVGSPASEVTAMLGSGSAEFLKSTRSLTTKRVAENIESIITSGFTSEISVPVTEKEMLRDMWGRAYWDNVIKGYAFNENSTLQEISAVIKLLGNMKGKEKETAAAISEIALSSGFSEKETGDGSIKLTAGDGRLITITYVQNSGLNIQLR